MTAAELAADETDRAAEASPPCLPLTCSHELAPPAYAYAGMFDPYIGLGAAVPSHAHTH